MWAFGELVELYWIGDITDFMYHIRKLSVKMFATYSISDQVRIPDYRHRTWFQTRNFLCSTLSSVNYLCLCSAIDWGIPRVRLYPAILTRLTLECNQLLCFILLINKSRTWSSHCPIVPFFEALMTITILSC